jgi:hypothetical protein
MTVYDIKVAFVHFLHGMKQQPQADGSFLAEIAVSATG